MTNRPENNDPAEKPMADETERLREEVAELDALRDKLADILSRTAVALRGPEPPLTRWSWHDLPERAAAAIAAIDVMQRAAMMAAEDIGSLREAPAKARAEIERLREALGLCVKCGLPPGCPDCRAVHDVPEGA